MKTLFNRILAYSPQIYKGILFLGTVALVVYLFPKEGKFQYEFQKGKPWLHENLIAPFDFAIQKSNEDIETLKNQVRASSLPHFVYDDSIVVNHRDQLPGQIQSTLSQLRPQLVKDSLPPMEVFLSQGRMVLDSVYRKGIVRLANVNLDQEEALVLIRGNLAQNTSMSELFSIQTATDFIMQYPYSHRSVREVLEPLLIEHLEHNVFYDEATTLKVLEDRLNHIPTTRGMVQKGEIVIFKGNLVDEEKFLTLNSLKREYEAQVWTESSYNWILLGQLLLTGVTLMVLFLFLKQYRSELFEDPSKLTFILLNIVLMVLMATAILKFNAELLYLIPFCILPLILRAFFDTRLALFTHLVTVLIIGFLAPNGFEFVFLQLIAGIMSILTVVSMYRRADLFITAAKITGIYIVSYFGIAILQEGSINQLKPVVFGLFVANGVLTLFAYPLIYAFERLFGLVSDISLLELSDTNNPLLKELSQKAPGTFQHSLQVANLAEEVIAEIGGNALLIRTAALYHDIGKMKNPLYFIENQTSGFNPHDELSFEESAEIIIAHVSDGVKLAKKNKLPDRIIDFIRTHHGTSMVQYFYKQYLKNFPDEVVDKTKFSYKGPRPFSRETAVLMMSDAVEAASRSLKEPNAENIDGLVEGIINHQMSERQFENVDITMKDLSDIKKIFKKKLRSIYHVRVEYPE